MIRLKATGFSSRRGCKPRFQRGISLRKRNTEFDDFNIFREAEEVEAVGREAEAHLVAGDHRVAEAHLVAGGQQDPEEV